jgi:hypothetical protein
LGGVLSALGSGTGSSGTAGTSDTASSGTKINSLLDLVQTTATSTPASTTPNTNLQTPNYSNSILPNSTQTNSPFSNDTEEMNNYLPLLYDNLTISDKPIVGRININQAPRSVLELLAAQDDELTDSVMLLGAELDATSQLAATAGLGSQTSFSDIQTAEIIEGILAERMSDPNLIDQPEMNYPFWPYTHGIVTDLETMKKLEPYFCTQGAVFKAIVVGRFDEQSPVVRLEVWLDASSAGKPARVIRIREMTELGPGYAAEMLGADELRRTQR